MTKIEEIKDRIVADGGYTDYDDCIDQCMKEYAEYYAKKCLEIAAVDADCYDRGYDLGHGVDPNSILNIKLPEHE